jgi:hypothetical protein
MRWTTPLLATLFFLSGFLAFAPAASAEDCVAREYPPRVSGGVVGATWFLAIDVANEGCRGGTDPMTYGDLTCDWLMGVTCEEMPDETIGLVTWFLP